MVKNRRAKGNRVQRKAVKELENNGWTVSIVERSGRFLKQKDMFNLFDISAICGGFLLLIQIKCNSTAGFCKKLKEFSKKHPVPGVVYSLYVWHDRKGWTRYHYQNGELMNKWSEWEK